MIPLILITGFLGSGKTTLMRRIAQEHLTRRYIFVVNEFAPVNVDGELMRESGATTVSEVVGGSIFCSCKSGEFIDLLRNIESISSGEKVDAVIVETSGIANPLIAGQMLKQCRLDTLYSLRSTVAIVAPGHFEKLLKAVPNLRAQLEAADAIVINKVDTVDDATVETMEHHICDINPLAIRYRSTYCRNLPDIMALPTHGKLLEGEEQTSSRPYATLVVSLEDEVNLQRLQRELDAFGDTLYRAKGYLKTESGIHYFDYSLNGLHVEESQQRQNIGQLVLIVNAAAEEKAQHFRKHLERSF